MKVETDEELVERFRDAGDHTAFDELVERHKVAAYRLALRLTRNHEDAHDISQEAFVRVFRSIDRFLGESSFRTWLYRIVTNVGLNHLRKTRRDRTQRTSIEDVVVPVPATSLRSMLENEARNQLDGAIDKLPARQKQTLLLKVFEEMKYTEIAGVMGCSVGTAKANFFHAVQSLKRALVACGPSKNSGTVDSREKVTT